MNETAKRIVDGIADEAERETVAQVVSEARALLGNRAYVLNGHHELGADAERRLRNAVVAEWSIETPTR